MSGAAHRSDLYWAELIFPVDQVEEYESVEDLARASDLIVIARPGVGYVGLPDDAAREPYADQFVTIPFRIETCVYVRVDPCPDHLPVEFFLPDSTRANKVLRPPDEPALLFIRDKAREVDLFGVDPSLRPLLAGRYRLVSIRGVFRLVGDTILPPVQAPGSSFGVTQANAGIGDLLQRIRDATNP